MASQAHAQAKPKITIGAVLPLTGVLAPYGKPNLEAITLAIDEVNKAGGIDGRELELVVEDTQASNTTAINALNKVLQSKPVAVIGPGLGTQILALQPLTEKAKVTLIVGHDTNVANLGGLLDAHWQVPGLAEDDPAPGGALVLTALHDKAGHRFVRIAYRSQTLDQIRTAGPLGQQDPYRTVIVPGACTATGDGTVCPLAVFEKLAGL